MTISNSKGILCAVAICISFSLSGCGGSSGSSSTGGGTSSKVTLTGTVSAPGSTTGAIAFAKPDSSLLRMFASLFSTQQVQAAAADGVAPVGAGVPVDLIQIDDSGNKLSTIASGSTDATGAYTIDAPASFVPATDYVVRATSPTDNTAYLDAIVTGTTVDVDPGTDFTKNQIITAASGVSNISLETIEAVQKTLKTLASGASSAQFSTLNGAKLFFAGQLLANEEASNIIASLSGSSVINGTVKDSTGTPLPGIKIVVRDFNNWVTRAITFTDASGAYSLHVLPGDYILGAVNSTANTSAGEWWTASGGAANMFSAGKVSVASSSTVTENFSLDPGVTISGTVTGESTSLPIGGIQIQLRDYVNDEPVTTVFTAKDGTYRINARPGSYTLGAYNLTFQPYATELYNTTLNGGIDATKAEKVTLTLGTPTTADFSLQTGYAIAGSVTDGVGGPIVQGMAVRFYTNTNAFVRGIRTNNLGNYRLWLRANAAGEPYTVSSRGQSLSVDLSAPSSQTGQDFTGAMGTITATLSDGTNPISQAKVRIYDSTGYLGFETSNGDGSVTLYAAAPVKVQPVIDNGTFIGTEFYNGVTKTSSATLVPVGTVLGTITLPAGGVLSGTVDVGGTTTGDRVVQVRSGGILPGNFFVNTRTQNDGSYSISLPPGSYNVRACNPADTNASTGCNNATSVWTAGTGAGQYSVPSITAGSITTLDLTAPN